jgi:hypothetical protein
MLGWLAAAVEEDWALASCWAGANPNKVPTSKKATEHTRTIKSSTLLVLLAADLPQLLTKVVDTLFLSP